MSFSLSLLPYIQLSIPRALPPLPSTCAMSRDAICQDVNGPDGLE